MTFFENHSGLYWYNAGWIENGHTPSEQYHKNLLAEYTDKYGEDNAEYLLSAEIDWVSNYSYCGFINSPFFPSDEMKDYTKKAAEHFLWEYLEFDGSMDFIMKLVNANWDETDFLIINPGNVILESFDAGKIKSN